MSVLWYLVPVVVFVGAWVVLARLGVGEEAAVSVTAVPAGIRLLAVGAVAGAAAALAAAGYSRAVVIVVATVLVVVVAAALVLYGRMRRRRGVAP